MSASQPHPNDMVPKARTSTVVVFLAAFAVILSWLGCYAVPNALIAADLIEPWSKDSDPRSTWMLNSFFALFIGFAVIGLLFKWSSYRQMRSIDAMAEGDEVSEND